MSPRKDDRAMLPQVQMALCTLPSLALSLCMLALGLAWRRRLARERDEANRRHEALAERLARLERDASATPVLSPRRVDRQLPSGPGSSLTSPTLIAVPNLATAAGSGDAPTTISAGSELGRRFGAIWGLADAGATAEAIARSTGQPIGQVELILGLKRQLAAASAGTRVP